MRELRDMVKEVLQLLRRLVSDLFNWLQDSLGPEVLEFIDDNKDLALKIVKEVAVDLADEIGEVKAKEAADRLVDALKDSVPDIESKNWLINLLIEIAVAAMKNATEN